MDKQNNPTKDLADVISLPKEITCVDGQMISYPCPTWRSELQVITSIGVILEHVGESMGVSWDELYQGFSAGDKSVFTRIIIKALEVAPKEVTKIVACIIHQEPDFVEERLDLPTILEILLPFLSQRIEKLLVSMTNMEESFGVLTQEFSEKLAQVPQEKVKKPR